MTSLVLRQYEEANARGEVKQMTEYLCIEPRHYAGEYRVRVNKETSDGTFRQFILYANGNFNIKITEGRKSQKKLDKIQGIIDSNIETLKDMWINNKYQPMADLIVTEFLTTK